nr:hypothetical protein [Tanacetum cinerariifolium]
MERYIRSKRDGKKVWKSIMSGPAPTPRTPILDATGAATTQTREKTDDEFTEEENARELIDYKAASILDWNDLSLPQNLTGRILIST